MCCGVIPVGAAVSYAPRPLALGCASSNVGYAKPGSAAVALIKTRPSNGSIIRCLVLRGLRVIGFLNSRRSESLVQEQPAVRSPADQLADALTQPIRPRRRAGSRSDCRRSPAIMADCGGYCPDGSASGKLQAQGVIAAV